MNDFKINTITETYLNKVVIDLKDSISIKIDINGYTDNKGNIANNLNLSKNRAKAIYEYLIQNGIEKNRLTYKGNGQNDPIADNSTEEGRFKNRRTTLVIKRI